MKLKKTASNSCVTGNSIKLQKLALSISPEWEHRAIKDGGRVKRFDVRSYYYLFIIIILFINSFIFIDTNGHKFCVQNRVS